ncbi:hypothetical protein Pmar_PMAR003261 [Perkinsus marinus ATCC 50983]|uniref:Uncharacterized protein n=1 Tax=Perkinsus marinus (strain ATCC 50983 / TXsc) TaxID=423536 RepID=C5L5P5_PERM5|nr:hypothetical protein Pmar_PMAR003261 [Perkinsus marinus ATCC 50983]EER07942.1 hypothetical protein Pmar_PMAR003261 [Perkinsus marinus ATCC 50983]|eukprot:XP_002776126.1 hypothetical protein Pmar_PMAR003261 [Perkinsus marinus ATCC 50983]
MPPESDTVIDYTTKEVVSGPELSAEENNNTTPDDFMLLQQQPPSGASSHYTPVDPVKDVLNGYDHSGSSSSTTGGLFGVSPSAATVDFLKDGRSSDIPPSSMFEDSRVMTSPVADLSWLGSKPATYNQELPTQRLSSTAQRLVSPPELTYPPMGDPLFSTVRSALDGMGTPQEAAGYGGFASRIGSQRPRPVNLHQQQKQQQASNILDKKVQEEHDRLIAERMQAELDREYEERLTSAPLPCEAVQHKQKKKEKKMGKMPKAVKAVKASSASSTPWGSPPKNEEVNNNGNASAEEDLAHEMAAHGIVLKKAKVKSHKNGRQQNQKVIPVGRK